MCNIVGDLSRVLYAASLIAFSAAAQIQVDPQIAAAIAKIKAIDNHAHPVRMTPPGEKDMEFDALPVDTMEPYTEPLRTRPESGEAARAHRAMFPSLTKKQIMDRERDRYPAWVLDQIGVDVMLANRVAMGPSMGPPRFLWVPYEDAFMYPLDNSHLVSRAPDYKELFADEERLLKRYLRNAGLERIPDSFDDYLSKVVTRTLEEQRRGGAIAVKFEAAYLRALDFANPPRSEAERVYSQHRNSAPSDADYKILQDAIFHHIAAECGRLGMAVHLHAAAGAGGYFNIAGANPMNMESVLNDPSLRKTNFVFIHGGWPFTRETTALLSKPNAYLDFSEQTFNNYPREVAASIRGWLEYAPEKVLYATDAYPFSEETGWEEAGWMANKTGREALGLALTGMLQDGEITRARAVELARMVLRENAAKLYKIH
ncbi:MAG: amidohydrolase family protein [Acidobacteriaceae bacterium]|nr:amidohydrolase family protein [Acidobacteriaceae bacterium]